MIIALQKFGVIESSIVKEILSVMNECYMRLQPHSVQIVDLLLFKESKTLQAFLSEEKMNLGIATSNFEESYFALHDAWRGTPRIMISFDRISELSNLVRNGGIRHEAAHTILHGSPEYYIFSTPEALKKLGTLYNIPGKTVKDILYLISIAVKDYEVTHLLCEKEYVEDQIAYNKHFLKPSDDDLQAWRIAQTNQTAKLLFFASLLKTTCSAIPLLKNRKHSAEIAESIRQNLNYLPSTLSSRIINSLKALSFPSFNTHENVSYLSNLFVETFKNTL